MEGRIVIASIHQLSNEVFELFDNLCLLSTGRTVYFGAISMAEKVPQFLLQCMYNQLLKTLERSIFASKKKTNQAE